MTRVFALIIAASLFACGPKYEKPSDFSSEDIAYTKDYRTDLCFAITSSHSHGDHYIVSITNVECTEKVLSMIGR
jgi:hypothetical protein